MEPETADQEIKDEEAELKACLQGTGAMLPDESVAAISTSTGITNGELEKENSDGFVSDPAKPFNALVEEELVLQSVTFVEARSPDALFFRTPELTVAFVKMQNALYAHFEEMSADEESNSGSIDVGLVYAAHFQGRWYRVTVVDCENHPDVVVSLLDKGLSTTVHASKIRRLPKELTLMPITVLQCSLFCVYPSSALPGWDLKVTQ